MSDLISRQAAIDIERNATVDTNPSHFEAHQKFMQFMDDAEISSFGRWQWSNGFNTALTAVGIDLKKLPSAQPEQKWIPCNERMPDESGKYMIWDDFGYQISNFDSYEGTFGQMYFAIDWETGEELPPRWVEHTGTLAWMPLPDPCKGEEDE